MKRKLYLSNVHTVNTLSYCFSTVLKLLCSRSHREQSVNTAYLINKINHNSVNVNRIIFNYLKINKIACSHREQT